jgi:hypothetical protein
MDVAKLSRTITRKTAARRVARHMPLPTADPRQGTPDSEGAYWARLGLGDIDRDRGHLDPALAAYRAPEASAKRMAKSDPGIAGWQRRRFLIGLKTGKPWALVVRRTGGEPVVDVLCYLGSGHRRSV